MKQILTLIFFGAVLAVAGYFFRAELSAGIARFESRFFPCATPITYTLGTFDTRFGISKNAFLDAVTQAKAIWEKAEGKKLFTYAADGNLKINLIYDYRQEATQKLKSLGIAVGSDKTSYDDLRAKYNAMQADYLQKKAAYDARVAAFKVREAAYEAAVATANKRGGASKSEYAQLNAEKATLDSEVASINALQADLNAEVDNINALVVVLNKLVTDLNLNVDQYNSIGQQRGAEFEEGLYKSDASGEEIDIYQFDTNARLVRVLAHELGHALGLPHVTDPKAIMYRLNESTNEKATAADLSALKALCVF